MFTFCCQPYLGEMLYTRLKPPPTRHVLQYYNPKSYNAGLQTSTPVLSQNVEDLSKKRPMMKFPVEHVCETTHYTLSDMKGTMLRKSPCLCDLSVFILRYTHILHIHGISIQRHHPPSQIKGTMDPTVWEQVTKYVATNTPEDSAHERHEWCVTIIGSQWLLTSMTSRIYRFFMKYIVLFLHVNMYCEHMFCDYTCWVRWGMQHRQQLQFCLFYVAGSFLRKGVAVFDLYDIYLRHIPLPGFQSPRFGSQPEPEQKATVTGRIIGKLNLKDPKRHMKSLHAPRIYSQANLCAKNMLLKLHWN